MRCHILVVVYYIVADDVMSVANDVMSEILLRYHLMISCLVDDIMPCFRLRNHFFYNIMPCSRVNHRCFTFPSWPVHLRLHLSPQRLHLPTPIKCFTHVSPLCMTCFISKMTAFLMTKHIEAIPRNDKSFSILQTELLPENASSSYNHHS